MNILLTGGTGFLGGELGKNLIESGHNLFFLVRDLPKACQKFSQLLPAHSSRIHFIKGEITLPGGGLSEEDLSLLQNNIDAFYHIAALVRFDEELENDIMAVNYQGTRHMIELADCIGAKKFLYVSTAYTVGTQEIGKESLYPLTLSYNNPYEKSKSLSEHYVMSFQRQMDISIFRPSIIVGDSRTGKADSEFTLYGFMRGLDVFKRKMAKRPEFADTVYRLTGDAEGNSNFIPVDYVCKVLQLGLTTQSKQQIFHVTNPAPPANHVIFSLIQKHLQFPNLSIIKKETLPVSFTPEEQYLNNLIQTFDKYLNRRISFQDTNTQHLLQEAGEPFFQIDDAMLETIISTYGR